MSDQKMLYVSGKVYAVGGHDGNEHLGSMEMFDPLTNKWMMKASMNTKRYVNLAWTFRFVVVVVKEVDSCGMHYHLLRYTSDRLYLVIANACSPK